MTPEQITHVAWEAGRAYFATIGNTDFTPWPQLARAEQLQHIITIEQELVAFRNGTLLPLSEDFPETARRTAALRHAIIASLSDAS